MKNIVLWFGKFFEEDNGKPSMIRLAMLITILVICFGVIMIVIKAFYAMPIIYNPSKETEAIQMVDYDYIFAFAFLFFGLLGAVGYAKVNQKKNEADISKQ